MKWETPTAIDLRFGIAAALVFAGVFLTTRQSPNEPTQQP